MTMLYTACTELVAFTTVSSNLGPAGFLEKRVVHGANRRAARVRNMAFHGFLSVPDVVFVDTVDDDTTSVVKVFFHPGKS